jgi:hypothetical protein
LPLDLRRIDGGAGIDGGNDAMHFDLVTVSDGDFGDGRDVTSEPHLLGDPAKHTVGCGLVPADSLRDGVENGKMLRMIRHQLAAEFERVLPDRMRQLIHEAFEIDRVLVAVDAAPDTRRNMGIAHGMVDQQMGDGVTQPRRPDIGERLSR